MIALRPPFVGSVCARSVRPSARISAGTWLDSLLRHRQSGARLLMPAPYTAPHSDESENDVAAYGNDWLMLPALL